MRSARVLGIVDQAAASASNLAITVIAAHALDRRAFGGFALSFAVYLFVLGGSRAVATEPLLLRGMSTARPAFPDAAGAMVMLGLLSGTSCAVLGLLLRGPARVSLLTLAPFLPFLLLQDTCRYAAFATAKPGRALVVDGVWIGAQALGMVWLVLIDSTDAASFMAVWAAAGAVAAIVGCIQARRRPALASATRWLRSNLDFGAPFFGEFLAAGGASYAALWGLGLFSGLPAVGAVRVAQTAFGPINLVCMGIYVTLLPEGAREAISRPENTRRLMVRASVLLVVLTVLWTGGALAVPSELGVSAFGDTWPLAGPLLLPLGIATCAGSVAVGATAGLRALGAARASLRTRIVTTPVMLLIPLGGAAIADEFGFTLGIAVAGWLTSGLWWAAFGRALRGAMLVTRRCEETTVAPAGEGTR